MGFCVKVFVTLSYGFAVVPTSSDRGAVSNLIANRIFVLEILQRSNYLHIMRVSIRMFSVVIINIILSVVYRKVIVSYGLRSAGLQF